MGKVFVILGIITSFLFWNLSSYILLILSVIFTIGTFWSWGIMYNYAVKKAKMRKTYTERFYDFTKSEAESVPDWITRINMFTSLTIVILFIIGAIMKLNL